MPEGSGRTPLMVPVATGAAATHPHDRPLLPLTCQLKHSLPLAVASGCLHSQEPLPGKPEVAQQTAEGNALLEQSVYGGSCDVYCELHLQLRVPSVHVRRLL